MGPAARASLGLLAFAAPLLSGGFIAILVLVPISGAWATLSVVMLGLLAAAATGVCLFLAAFALGVKVWASK